MSTDSATAQLEERLERLAHLHVEGHLDDAEFRAAKARLLEPGPGAADATDAPVPAGPSRARLGWTGCVFLCLVLGWVVACLSSVFTSLQAPAGPFLCRDGTFVTGHDVEQYGGTTSFDIVASCVDADGQVDRQHQLVVLGVLWGVYSAPVALLVLPSVALLRRRRDGAETDLLSA